MSDERYCLKGTGGLLKNGPAPTCTRRTRWPLVIIGCVLLALQLLSIASSARFGGCPWQEPYFMAGRAFWKDLVRLLVYLPAGLAGVAVIVLALPRRRCLVAGCVAASMVLSVGIMAYVGTSAAEREQEAIANIIANANYVASSMENAVHRPDCKYAGWISSKNMVAYGGLEDALDAGKRPCRECFDGATSFSEWTILEKYGYGY